MFIIANDVYYYFMNVTDFWVKHRFLTYEAWIYEFQGSML